MDRSRFDRITRELMELRRMITSRSSAPQLAHSSFDSGPGHSIDEVDPETGQVVASYGTQYDGSHGAVPFVGPIPPVPTAPTLEASPAVLVATWDGGFAGGPMEVATLDWTHVEVHADQDPDFTADDAGTIIGTINTARGGKLTAAVGAGTWYVRLVSRSAAGKRSEATAPVMVVVPATVDVAPIQQELSDANAAIAAAAVDAAAAIAAASAALGTANGATAAAATADGKATTAQSAAEAAAAAAATADGKATTADGKATTAQTAATNAAAAATTADGKATTAQTAATNAAAAATTADGKATTAQTAATNAAAAAATADGKATAAQTAANNAAKKITVSANLPSGSGTLGDLWYRKNTTTGAFIGVWESQGGTTWTARTTDGGLISNMAVTNLVAGSGTMAQAVIDQIFADVVVAKTSVIATAFIGTNAIITGAITAPKITASQELTAKVAQFLEVNAGMVNTNSLWADAAWIAAARTHVLTVLQHTNGGGYTSTVTGQGLKVTYADPVTSRSWDVIRLGTFGADYLGISDGAGRALASITGAGEVGSTSMYSDGPVFSQGRQVDVDQAPKGEVAYGSLTTATTSITAAGNGIFEISFEAEPGRVYKIDGATNLSAANTTAVTPGLRLSYTTNGTIPQVGSTTIPIQGTPLYPSTATTAATTFPFHARFIPVPMATAGVQAPFTKVRVLISVTRVSGTGTAQAANTWMSITDAGTARRDNVGVNNGTSGTSTFADYTTVTETFPLLTPVGAPLIFAYQRNSNGTWPTLADGSTATGQMRVGVPVTGQPWKSLAYWGNAQYTSPFYRSLRASQGASLEIDSLRVNIKPTLFREGMGFIEFGFSNSAGWDPRGTAVPAWNGAVWARSTTVRVPAWGEGVTRSIEFPKTAYPWLLLPSAPIMFFMGMSLPDSTLLEPQAGVSINFEDISFTVTYRKKN